MRRFELSAVRWEQIAPLLPPQKPRTGQPAEDHCRILNGMLWILYALRDSYISRATEAGMPVTVPAENCGMSVRTTEKTYAKVLANARREFIVMAALRPFAA